MTGWRERRFGAGVFAVPGALALMLLWGGAAPGQSDRAAQQSPDALFLEQIRPLLERNCLGCHSGAMAQSGLDLSTREGLLRGGKRGPAVVPGDPQNSTLYKLVAPEGEPRMPPQPAERLSKDLVARLAAWIAAGAPYAAPSDARAADREQSPKPAGGAPGPSGGAGFDEHVRPVLEAKCLGCHGGGGIKRAGLDLSTREKLLAGGDNGPVVVAGKPESSTLLRHIRHELKPGMPLGAAKLPEEAVARIAEWIQAGAPYSGSLQLAVAPQAIQPARPLHWAFERPARPPVPAVKNSAWVRNPIDAFLAAEHEQRGLKPLPEADRRALLRRVFVDLIGLPPTRDELHAFLNDSSAGAYEKVVDRLLADPRYGERWGRHWMDVWRYSDPDGFAGRVDYSQRHIWQWRDWIIESLNRDKGYDRMVIEMLAGDELAPTDPETLRATGYLARSWYRFNRHSWLQDTVDHTASAFLGITLRCARCHEHKYDPIEQEEYYRFRAFFEPYDVRTDEVPGEPDPNKKGLPRAYDAEAREAKPDEENSGVLLPAIFGKTQRLIRGEETNPEEHALEPGFPKSLGGAAIDIRPLKLPLEASYPALRSFVREDLRTAASAEISRAEANLARVEKALARARDRVLNAPAAETSSVAGGRSSGEPTAAAPDPLASFEKEIRPIFEKRCFACHSAQTSRSGLSLETLESVLAGGNRMGPAAVPGNTEESPLLLYLRGEKKPRMPLNGEPLKEEQITRIGDWVRRLPEGDPAAALERAEVAVAIARKELAWARASLPALEARIAADDAKFRPPPEVDAEALAERARKVERQAHLLKAEANLIRAQQKLSRALSGPAPADDQADKDREKKIAAARKDLDEAQKALTLSTKSYTPIGRIYPDQSSGRRTALARWIASKENPLAARVAVNHMWLRHFGKALVATVENFGSSGAPPTHARLLDWLAVEFMEKSWSMKAMHRLMATSSAYRMQSATPNTAGANLAIDAENRYLWRMNPRRMEAEAVRDGVLYVAGELDSRIGGPEEEDAGSRRRGMYFKQTPLSQIEFLKLFDAANPAECYQRAESIVPQQALALSNSALSLTMARKLARTLSLQTEGNSGHSAFVTAAFETLLGRPPTAQESVKVAEFLRRQAELLSAALQGAPSGPAKLTPLGVRHEGEVSPASDPARRARENLVHVLFNHHEFVTVR